MASLGIAVDDGQATSWSTVGSRIGRFARALTSSEQSALDTALAEARESSATRDVVEGKTPPSGTTEELVGDGLDDLELDPQQEAPAGYRDLVAVLRALRESLAESPVAVLELAVGGSPLGAQLRHAGREPVPVRLGPLTVEATLFDADSAIVDHTIHTVDASLDGPVGPGWELPLVADLGIAEPRTGGFLLVKVGSPEVDALGDGVLRRVELGWMRE